MTCSLTKTATRLESRTLVDTGFLLATDWRNCGFELLAKLFLVKGLRRSVAGLFLSVVAAARLEGPLIGAR
jgi:hypothetical protein